MEAFQFFFVLYLRLSVLCSLACSNLIKVHFSITAGGNAKFKTGYSSVLILGEEIFKGPSLSY
jgi:hypothetical protein